MQLFGSPPATGGFAGYLIAVLVADLDVRVLTEDGELLRAITLDPSTDYQRPIRT